MREQGGGGSPDTALLFLISLRSEGHRGVFSWQEIVDKTNQNKVKMELLKDSGFV